MTNEEMSVSESFEVGQSNANRIVQKMRDSVKKEFEKQKSKGKSDEEAWHHASSTRDGAFMGKKQRDILKKELLGESMAIGNTTQSIPDTSNMGYKKRDKRRKDDVEHMYRRNLLNKATNILKKKRINESSEYPVYHNTYSAAIQAAEDYAKKKGYDVDKEEWADKIGLGPKKPSGGKTNKFSLTLYKNGKEQKKMLQIQIYNRETNGNPYELNMYIR